MLHVFAVHTNTNNRWAVGKSLFLHRHSAHTTCIQCGDSNIYSNHQQTQIMQQTHCAHVFLSLSHTLSVGLNYKFMNRLFTCQVSILAICSQIAKNRLPSPSFSVSYFCCCRLFFLWFRAFYDFFFFFATFFLHSHTLLSLFVKRFALVFGFDSLRLQICQ